MFDLTVEQLQEKQAEVTVKEIYQQPSVWKELAEDFFAKETEYKAFVEAIYAKHEHVRVIFSGAGTSAFIGDIISPILNKQHIENVHFEAVATTDIVSNPAEYFHPTTPTILVSFARSGNSPESVATVALGQKIVNDFYQINITCNRDGKLAVNSKDDEKALTLLMPERSNDKGLAMTSSFSSMIIGAYALFTNDKYTKKVAGNLTTIGQTVLDTVSESIYDILTFDFNRLVYLGSGALAQLGHETSLKMLELTGGKVMATYESSLGFRHGPKAMLDDQSLIVVFVSEDPYTKQYDVDILKELAQAKTGMKIVALTEKADADIEKLADWTIAINDSDETLEDDFQRAVIYTLFAQGLAVSKSSHLGIAPDNPSPDGEINRVVQGVTIHNYE